MQVSKSYSKSYKLKQFLYLPTWFIPKFPNPKHLKNLSLICHIQSQRKVTEPFQNRIKNIWNEEEKFSWEKVFGNK